MLEAARTCLEVGSEVEGLLSQFGLHFVRCVEARMVRFRFIHVSGPFVVGNNGS